MGHLISGSELGMQENSLLVSERPTLICCPGLFNYIGSWGPVLDKSLLMKLIL